MLALVPTNPNFQNSTGFAQRGVFEKIEHVSMCLKGITIDKEAPCDANEPKLLNTKLHRCKEATN